MNYKLINKQTGEETLCDKVTIDGIDYYVSDELPKLNNVVITSVGNIHYIKDNSKDFIEYISKLGKKIIATNNPNIDIPKIVNEVEELALKTTLQPKVLFDKLKKCSQNDALLIDEFGDYNIVKYRETTGFISGYNKSQETHPFSEDDMKNFGKFCIENNVCKEENRYYQYWELLQLWKEQQLKTVYYA